jgi:hypothetical protein
MPATLHDSLLLLSPPSFSSLSIRLDVSDVNRGPRSSFPPLPHPSRFTYLASPACSTRLYSHLHFTSFRPPPCAFTRNPRSPSHRSSTLVSTVSSTACPLTRSGESPSHSFHSSSQKLTLTAFLFLFSFPAAPGRRPSRTTSRARLSSSLRSARVT